MRRNPGAGLIGGREDLLVFAETGLLRLPGAFTPAEAAEMVRVVDRHAERWLASHPTLSWKRVKRNPAFAPFLGNDAVRRALDEVFPVGWQASKSGVQVLYTPPGNGPWALPAGGWHTDLGFAERTWPPAALKLFGCLGAVEPRGGGTLVLEGSHRLVERWTPSVVPAGGGSRPVWARLMRHDPWLAEVYAGGGHELVGSTHEVDGVPLRVTELTGRPGDVFVLHLHSFHCVAPNASDVPRRMVAAPVLAQPMRRSSLDATSTSSSPGTGWVEASTASTAAVPEPSASSAT